MHDGVILHCCLAFFLSSTTSCNLARKEKTTVFIINPRLCNVNLLPSLCKDLNVKNDKSRNYLVSGVAV